MRQNSVLKENKQQFQLHAPSADSQDQFLLIHIKSSIEIHYDKKLLRRFNLPYKLIIYFILLKKNASHCVHIEHVRVCDICVTPIEVVAINSSLPTLIGYTRPFAGDGKTSHSCKVITVY